MAYQAYRPGVSFFIEFYRLDPSSNNQCIYFTLKGARCSWPCSDYRQAIALRETIIAASGEAVSLDLLQRYILSNCCISGYARHRQRMEKSDLLIPLAQRWQDEIRSHAVSQFNPTTSASPLGPPATPTPSHTTPHYAPTGNQLYSRINFPTPYDISATRPRPIVNSQSYQYDSTISSIPALENSSFVPQAYTTPVTPTPTHTASHYAPSGGPLHYQVHAPTSFGINDIPSGPGASSSSYQQHSPPGFLTTTEIASQRLGSQTCYGPYPCGVNIPASSTVSSSSHQYGSPITPITVEIASQPLGSQQHHGLRPHEADIFANSTIGPTSTSPAPLSEYREYVPKLLRNHSSSRKILNALEERDLQTGSLYIFERDSFPGHVKIGWTANSVQMCLEEWSKCGFKPNLLFEVNGVPHAQRVKTLTHHELIMEWRLEKCSRCEITYHEWFKISKEKAEQVVGNWADFITKAEPYDSEGLLKTPWRKVIELMDGNGEMVTGKKLLDYYHASLFEEATIVRDLANLRHTPKVGFEDVPTVQRHETPKVTSVRGSSLRIEQSTLPKEEPLIKSVQSLPEQPLLGKIPPTEARKRPKSHPVFNRKPLATSESSIQAKPLPNAQFLFRAEPPFKIEPLSKTELLPKSELVREEVPARETTPVKEELPRERERFSPSTPPSSTSPYNTFSLQETKLNTSTGTKEASATHITTNSDTNITVVDTSSYLEINSPSGRASPLVTPGEGNPQKNTHTNTDTNTANLLPPIFSGPASKLNPTDLSASPRRKVEPLPDPRAPLVMDIMKVLLSLNIDELEETTKTLASIMQRRQNVERGGQVEPERKLPEYDGQKHEEEDKSHDEDEDTATEDEAGEGADGLDADETLVGDQIQLPLEDATVKIADGLFGNAKGVPNGLEGPKTLQSEVPPAVEVVAQA